MRLVTIFLLLGEERYSHPIQRQMRWIHGSFLLEIKSSAYAAEINNMVGLYFLLPTSGKNGE